MDKMKMESVNMTEKNVEKIEALFPNCITESVDENGNPKKDVNFDVLKQMLSDEVIEGDEAYEFTWVGKKASIVEANKPIRRTLRPCIEESVDWNNTKNLYIEGDNLDVLKLLQESYLESVKLIYIDPPYNTGNDFIYQDDFKKSEDEYEEELGVFDEEGVRLFRNTDTNGRFHSDWCSMINSRLMLARNLLSDEGVIFVSIDEHEIDNCLKIMDDIFGRSNRVGVIVVKSNPRGSMSIGEIANLHEYIAIYCKNTSNSCIVGHYLSEEMENEYKYEDNVGKYRLLGLRMRGGFWRRSERPNLFFPIYVNPDDCTVSLEKTNSYCEEAIPVQPSTMEDGTWRWSKERIQTDKHLLIGRKVKRGDVEAWDIYQKDYFMRDGGRRTKAKSIWDSSEINYQNGATEIKKLFGTSVFDYSKPVFLLSQVIEMIGMNNGDIVMDFFSGSATTAHAVFQANAKDNCKRSFIMVQLPEPCGEKSEAYKAGYRTIAEIGKERIRRAGKKIYEETGANIDYGFRVLKLDDSNMKDVYYSADEIDQQTLASMESNIKEDRTDLDLLFGCLIDWGLPLSLPYSSEEIDGCTVHTYNPGDKELGVKDALIACFDESIPDSVVETIAKRQPLRVVFRDSSFVDSPAKINVEEVFKLYAPDTSVKVI